MTPQIAILCATLCRSFLNQLRSPQMNCGQYMGRAVQNRQANCSCHACYVAVLQTLEEYHENTAAKISRQKRKLVQKMSHRATPETRPPCAKQHWLTSLYTISPVAQADDTNVHSWMWRHRSPAERRKQWIQARRVLVFTAKDLLFNDAVSCLGYILSVVDEWICSIGGMVLKRESGALVEWYWQGKADALGEKPALVPLRRHISHMDWTGTELALRGERPETNHVSQGTDPQQYRPTSSPQTEHLPKQLYLTPSCLEHRHNCDCTSPDEYQWYRPHAIQSIRVSHQSWTLLFKNKTFRELIQGCW
jgi:hypothetical protein